MITRHFFELKFDGQRSQAQLNLHARVSVCRFIFLQQGAGLIVAVVTAAGYPGADGARKFVPAFFLRSFSV